MNEHSRWMISHLHVQGWSNCTNETMAGFRFIRMQIIMFRLNLKFAFVHTVRSGERDKSRSLIHNYSARVYENIDRLPPFSPQSFRLATVVKRQKSRDKNKILSETFGWIRRFYSRIMLFSCFRRMIVYLKYRSSSREQAWWEHRVSRRCQSRSR